MTLLTELANKYISDKGSDQGHSHNFTEFYSKYFESIRFDVRNVLEIGVCDGASLKMWKDYFPNATIVGADILDKSEYCEDRIHTIILDQSNLRHLDTAVEAFKNNDLEFDIIIDDGSHHMWDQQITLLKFLDVLKKDGLYVIEDLHTSLAVNGTPLYGRPVEIMPGGINTTLFMLEKKFEYSRYLTNSELKTLQKSLEILEINEIRNPRLPEWGGKQITSMLKRVC